MLFYYVFMLTKKKRQRHSDSLHADRFPFILLLQIDIFIAMTMLSLVASGCSQVDFEDRYADATHRVAPSAVPLDRLFLAGIFIVNFDRNEKPTTSFSARNNAATLLRASARTRRGRLARCTQR